MVVVVVTLAQRLDPDLVAAGAGAGAGAAPPRRPPLHPSPAPCPGWRSQTRSNGERRRSARIRSHDLEEPWQEERT
uniref:Uncharacterized protein n=1 Tax=Arundo donax TaxID=35708 RepID=A0A0A9GBQ3_ARUDO